MTYEHKLTNLYKIWFSNNQNDFLPYCNKVRLKEFRKSNPDAVITLIYSSKCLSDKSKDELVHFCKRYNVFFVDFDEEICKLIKTELAQDPQNENLQLEFKISQIATDEIQKTLSDEGGNLASASDAVRYLNTVIEQYGVYSDFDVNVSFFNLKSIQSKSPLIINGNVLFDYTNNTHGAQVANDFIAVTLNEDGNIHEEASVYLRAIKRKIVHNYENFDDVLTDIIENNEMLDCYSNILRIHNVNTIFQFRKIIANVKSLRDFLTICLDDAMSNVFYDTNEITDISLVSIGCRVFLLQLQKLAPEDHVKLASDTLGFLSQISQKLNMQLYIQTVTHFSGPGVLCQAFLDIGIDCYDETLTQMFVRNTALNKSVAGISMSGKVCLFHDMAPQICIDNNDSIQDSIQDSDSSWTHEGQLQLTKASEKKAGLLIWSKWQDFKKNKILTNTFLKP